MPAGGGCGLIAMGYARGLISLVWSSRDQTYLHVVKNEIEPHIFIRIYIQVYRGTVSHMYSVYTY